MGRSPGPGGRLGTLTHEQRSLPRFSEGLCEAQLGTFSQGRYKVSRKDKPYRFLFPTCLSYQILTLSTFCWNSANLSFSSNCTEFAGSAATILLLCQPESHPFPRIWAVQRDSEGRHLDSTDAPEGALTSRWVVRVPLGA